MQGGMPPMSDPVPRNSSSLYSLLLTLLADLERHFLGIYIYILIGKDSKMGFYEQISKYYDYIFPVGAEQLDFIKSSAGSPPGRLLDVACGTGGYSEALAKSGYSVVSVDLDGKMVEMAREKAANGQLDMKVLQCDMGNITDTVSGSFDCIFCIGNSLVHLDDIESVRNSLGQMHAKLLTGGHLLLQIINFDRIFKYGISSLPEITSNDAGLSFLRNYRHNRVSGKIHFDTTLTIEDKSGFSKYDNSVELLPLTSLELISLMKAEGFGSIEIFGDFNRGSFTADSYLLVIDAAE